MLSSGVSRRLRILLSTNCCYPNYQVLVLVNGHIITRRAQSSLSNNCCFLLRSPLSNLHHLRLSKSVCIQLHTTRYTLTISHFLTHHHRCHNGHTGQQGDEEDGQCLLRGHGRAEAGEQGHRKGLGERERFQRQLHRL